MLPRKCLMLSYNLKNKYFFYAFLKTFYSLIHMILRNVKTSPWKNLINTNNNSNNSDIDRQVFILGIYKLLPLWESWSQPVDPLRESFFALPQEPMGGQVMGWPRYIFINGSVVILLGRQNCPCRSFFTLHCTASISTQSQSRRRTAFTFSSVTQGARFCFNAVGVCHMPVWHRGAEYGRQPAALSSFASSTCLQRRHIASRFECSWVYLRCYFTLTWCQIQSQARLSIKVILGSLNL